MIRSMAEFVDYFTGIRRRTLNYVRALPADRLSWSPSEGEYTCGDLIWHIMATEQTYVHLITDGNWRYQGHTGSADQTYEDLLAQMTASHDAACATLRGIDDAELMQPRPSLVPDGPAIKVWRWLMAMVEHEVHHRSQLASYLTQMGIQPPQIYGVTVEEMIARATQ